VAVQLLMVTLSIFQRRFFLFISLVYPSFPHFLPFEKWFFLKVYDKILKRLTCVFPMIKYVFAKQK